MSHPIHNLARALQRRRSLAALDRALSDPHLARDIGLPPRKTAPRGPQQW